MTTDWKNRTAVITGGGSGIGREAALKLARNGMNIILLGGKRAEMLQETADLVKEYGVKTAVIPGDLTDFVWLKETVAQITQTLDVDVLINNAGMASNCGYEDVTEEQFDSIMNLNVKVPFFLTQHLLPTLYRLQTRPAGTDKVPGGGGLWRRCAGSCHLPRRGVHRYGEDCPPGLDPGGDDSAPGHRGNHLVLPVQPGQCRGG